MILDKQYKLQRLDFGLSNGLCCHLLDILGTAHRLVSFVVLSPFLPLSLHILIFFHYSNFYYNIKHF